MPPVKTIFRNASVPPARLRISRKNQRSEKPHPCRRNGACAARSIRACPGRRKKRHGSVHRHEPQRIIGDLLTAESRESGALDPGRGRAVLTLGGLSGESKNRPPHRLYWRAIVVATSSGFTNAPGPTFCRLPQITPSPSETPVNTATRSPSLGPSDTSRCSNDGAQNRGWKYDLEGSGTGNPRVRIGRDEGRW